MAKVIDNPSGRRVIRLSIDDVLMVVGQYQQICNSKTLDKKEVRKILIRNRFYLPEDM